MLTGIRAQSVRVYKGARLQAASVACKVEPLSGGVVRLRFCQDNMTVDLPAAVVRQIAQASRT